MGLDVNQDGLHGAAETRFSYIIYLHTCLKAACLISHSSTLNTVLSAEAMNNLPSKKGADFAELFSVYDIFIVTLLVHLLVLWILLKAYQVEVFQKTL